MKQSNQILLFGMYIILLLFISSKTYIVLFIPIQILLFIGVLLGKSILQHKSKHFLSYHEALTLLPEFIHINEILDEINEENYWEYIQFFELEAKIKKEL